MKSLTYRLNEGRKPKGSTVDIIEKIEDSINKLTLEFTKELKTIGYVFTTHTDDGILICTAKTNNIGRGADRYLDVLNRDTIKGLDWDIKKVTGYIDKANEPNSAFIIASKEFLILANLKMKYKYANVTFIN